MENNRMAKRKKKRKRSRILVTLLFLFLIISGYVLYEYWAGIRSADSDGPISGEENFDDFKGVASPEGKTNVLLLGVDRRGNETSTRSDTIMIAQYDAENDQMKLLSLMRDTYVNIPGVGYSKLNAAFAYGGPELMRQTIKENFGVNLEYYSVVDFDGFSNIVNTLAPNGVEIEVEKDMYYKDSAGTIDLEQGTQTLNGDELLGYARFRHDARGDYARVERQQKVIKALKEEAMSINGLTKLPRLVGTIQPYIETNMGKMTIASFGKDFILNTPGSIETKSIPADIEHWDGRVNGAAVIMHNEEVTKQAVQEFLE
ncbi:LCP family protein [Pontibacillus salicampi]|uniref:Regulatory protein MsrR n=1 Tax=Pontibacillus salicampi TaxID=1449801 RepID=A0ABV6LKV1_9BACI